MYGGVACPPSFLEVVSLMWMMRLLFFAGGEDKGTDLHEAEWSRIHPDRHQSVTTIRENVLMWLSLTIDSTGQCVEKLFYSILFYIVSYMCNYQVIRVQRPVLRQGLLFDFIFHTSVLTVLQWWNLCGYCHSWFQIVISNVSPWWSLPIIKCYLCSEFSADAFHFESEVLNKTISPALNKKW